MDNFQPFAEWTKVNDTYYIHTEAKDLLCIVAGYSAAKHTPRDYPNCARRLECDFEIKHAPRTWSKQAGIEYVFFVPTAKIQINAKETHSYPEIKIDDTVITLNAGGGTWSKDGIHGWTDSFYEITSACINHPVSILDTLNANAVRGTRFEPYRTRQEEEAEFYATHANDYLVVCAHGDWAWNVPAGMVYVSACIGGHNAPEYQKGLRPPQKTFLVPESEYNQRATQFVIDPARHIEWAADESYPYCKPKTA